MFHKFSNGFVTPSLKFLLYAPNYKFDYIFQLHLMVQKVWGKEWLVLKLKVTKNVLLYTLWTSNYSIYNRHCQFYPIPNAMFTLVYLRNGQYLMDLVIFNPLEIVMLKNND